MREPTTEAELFDYLAYRHGVGDYDYFAMDEKPYYKVRMNEIGKLKRLMKARRVVVREVYTASRFAQREGRSITTTQQLFRLIPEAMRAWRKDVLAAQTKALATDVLTVQQEAYAAGDVAFAGRLARATTQEQMEMAATWRREHQ